MSISGLGSISNNNYIGRIASGKKIQTAADDAAGLSIVQSQNAQVTGLERGAKNLQDAKGVLNVSDAALSGINDNLQRIRELAVSSRSGIMSDDDKKAMQEEVDQLKKGIEDIAAQTQFNGKKLLDGSTSSLEFASDAQGQTQSITTPKSTLDELGIADLDITGNFSMSDIDNAIKKVSDSRSVGGAESNALDFSIDYDLNSASNLSASASRIEDEDYPQAILEQKKKETLQMYSMLMEKKKMQSEEQKAKNYFI